MRLDSDTYNTHNTLSSALLQTFYFISFLLVLVYAWKSKGAIQGWRAAPPGDEVGHLLLMENGSDLEPLMAPSLLSWFHRIRSQRRRSPRPCMRLCGECMAARSTIAQTPVLHLPSCFFCLMSQVDPHCHLRRLCAHSPHKTLCGDSRLGPIADRVYPQRQ